MNKLYKYYFYIYSLAIILIKNAMIYYDVNCFV